MRSNIFRLLVDELFSNGNERCWSDGEEILCSTEERAEYLADLLEDIGYEVRTGYYDPEEDERNDEADEHTGYWYVDVG